MATREIERTQWRTFFDAFTRERAGRLAQLEDFGPVSDSQEETQLLPSVGISTDSPHDSAIEVLFETERQDYLTYVVSEPRRVRFDSHTRPPVE